MRNLIITLLFCCALIGCVQDVYHYDTEINILTIDGHRYKGEVALNDYDRKGTSNQVSIGIQFDMCGTDILRETYISAVQFIHYGGGTTLPGHITVGIDKGFNICSCSYYAVYVGEEKLFNYHPGRTKLKEMASCLTGESPMSTATTNEVPGVERVGK